MPRRNIFEPLSREAELVRHEDEVHIDPVVRLLIEGVGGERVADVEDVAVDVLGCVGGEVGCEGVGRC